MSDTEDHVVIDIDDGGVSPVEEAPLTRSRVARPSPDEARKRAAIFAEIDRLKKEGHVIRRPNAALTLDKLEARLAEIKANIQPVIVVTEAPPPKKISPVSSKPKAVKISKKVVDPNDYSSDEPTRKAHQGMKPMIHTMYYSALAGAGAVAGNFGFKEFSDVGRVAKQNDAIIDPILDDLAKEWGLGGLGDGGLGPEATLALITGTMAAHCYLAAHPTEMEPVRGAVEIAAAVFSLNLGVSHILNKQSPR